MFSKPAYSSISFHYLAVYMVIPSHRLAHLSPCTGSDISQATITFPPGLSTRKICLKPSVTSDQK